MAGLDIKKILISDKVDPSCVDILRENGLHADLKPGRSEQELKDDLKNYDALIVRSATKVTKEIIECGTNLKMIGRAGVGVDNIDIPAATAKGILVMNTPAGNTLSAAEHTCALISAISRHIGQAHESLSSGKWERSKFMGSELNGKKLAIIGLGRIGRDVAHRMQSFGMTTIGFDPLVSKDDAATFGVEWLELAEIWPIADYITVHVPLIKVTTGMINKDVFSKCKPSVKVINVARGGIIDEEDLIEALKSGTCGGAALDVFCNEPPTGAGSELIKHPKVLCTPHLGASTVEAQLRVAKEVAQNIVDAVRGKPMSGLVNAPALSQLASPEYKPWFELATGLGKVLLSMEKMPEKEIVVDMSGSALASASRLISHGVAFGVAQVINADTVNRVNCMSLLKENDFKVTSRHNPNTKECSLLITNGNNSITGAIVGTSPVLTEVNGIRLYSPVTLCQHIAIGTDISLDDAIKMLSNGAKARCFTTGLSENKSVVVATFGGSVGPEVAGKMACVSF